ncbi:protein AF-10 isoform X3 [Anabrus simplex]|uniref:protein AF-10 isoform X3 n=1 Tax=Anabrus simplex TaxID=316456 RepID=UPI0035A3A31E
MKEMVGGCCVCSDERGWAENPLVYCDGQGCTVAVHQACYGIVTVPTGPWFCRKCESQERAVRVRCELCPSRDGALKRTDNSGWAHVVCALYIPEVRFGNVTTMEPIILQLIPPERFSKVCYICEEQGKGSRATIGACMQCNKSGCKQQFHVTCAQALGLLCEEAGNYLDNVKYCGYCQHHYSKLKKGGNVKTIPPYKPIPADNGSSDSSPEKELDIVVRQQGVGGAKRKSGGKAATAAVVNSGKGSGVGKIGGGHSPATGDISSVSPDITGETSKGSSPSSNKDTIAAVVPNSIAGNAKFTTSNFVESVVMPQGESAFGTDILQQTPRNTIPPPSTVGKKRRTGGSRTPTMPSENSSDSLSSVSAVVINPSHGGNINTTSLQDSHMINSSVADPKKLKVDSTNHSSALTTNVSSESVVVSNIVNAPSSNVITPPPSTHQSSNSMTSGIVVSVPLTAASLQPSVQVPAPSMTTEAGSGLRFSMEEQVPPPPPPSGKRSRSQSTEKVEKGRNKKRGSTGVNNITTTTTTTTSTTIASITTSTPTTIITTAAATPITTITTTTTPVTTFATTATTCATSSICNSTTTITTTAKRCSRSSHNTPPPVPLPTVKDSPPSSPGSETASMTSGGRRSRNKKSNGARDMREEKDVKLFENGVSAPHMLGNQLNPSSSMAQKMSHTLSAELEAHSIFTDANSSSSALIGPPLHSRVIASVRSVSNSSAGAAGISTSAANNNNSANAAAPGSIPQSLDQLLERQWEQGSQFLMEQAQHFDIASLLSCLHQLRAENMRLEEHVSSLLQRRDHLLAVNARLAIPLSSQPPAQVNNVHPGVTSTALHQQQDPSRAARVNNSFLPHPMENGLPPDPSPPSGNVGYPHTQPSPTIRQSPASSSYMPSQSPLSAPSASSASSTPGVVRSTSATPDPPGRTSEGRRSSYPVYQVAAPAASQVPVVTTQQAVTTAQSTSLFPFMEGNSNCSQQ